MIPGISEFTGPGVAKHAKNHSFRLGLCGTGLPERVWRHNGDRFILRAG
jgi:hypothetical protein